MSDTPIEKITTKIWRETPEPDNPFAAANCYCCGYDVYDDLLKNASYIDYLYLLFKQQQPTPSSQLYSKGWLLRWPIPAPEITALERP